MVEKIIVLALFICTFALILYRRIPIYYISIGAALILIVTSIVPVGDAFLKSVNWSVLSIYFGYGMLAVALRESGLPAAIANWLLPRIKKEKYALLFLCALAAFLSAFMANPVVVLMLAPFAIELAERQKSSLFIYLISLAISSNAVTTVTMVADPPALILAMNTGMSFMDFYWFKGRIGLGTLSVVGIIMALLTLFLQFRKLDKPIATTHHEIRLKWGPIILFIVSVLALVVPPGKDYPGIVGLVLGFVSLLFIKDKLKELKEFDWSSLAFLVGIFILVDSVDRVGLLKDFADWLPRIGLTNPVLMLIFITWLSVLLSSFIDNVPYTVLMIPTCTYIAQSLGIEPFGLYFGMLVGTGIGGNITPVGATANVLACGMLEKRGYVIKLSEYLKLSIPFSIAAVLSVQLLIQWIWM